LLTVSKNISERGYTMVEMLVAMFVLAVVGATLHDQEMNKWI
jgi:prepilin-type N-terminal cleavage/methylation domain-containing protein